MSDTYVTFQGWLGTEVTHRRPNGVSVANFRVASTPRIKRGGQWTDGETTWFSVAAWRGLADNVRDSLRKGDPVIVHGRLRTESWLREDQQRTTTMVVDASIVGHDLVRGTTTFMRTQRPERDTDVHEEVAEMMHAQVEETASIDHWRQPDEQPDEPGEEGQPEEQPSPLAATVDQARAG